MVEKWFVLKLPQECGNVVNDLREKLFRLTGDPSARMLPSVVFLGRSGSTTIPHLVKAPEIGVISDVPVFKDGKLVLPVSGFEALARELGLRDSMPCIYLCSQNRAIPTCTFPIIDDFRLALLEIEADTRQITWLFLEQRRLWKGKA